MNETEASSVSTVTRSSSPLPDTTISPECGRYPSAWVNSLMEINVDTVPENSHLSVASMDSDEMGDWLVSITDLAEMSSLRHDRNDSVSDDDLAGSLHRFIILDTSDHHDDGADMLHEFSLICSPWGRYGW